MITRLIAVTLALGAVLAPVASADPVVELGQVRVEDGKAHLTVTVRDLPGGSPLDPGAVRVEIDGTPVPATATSAGEPQRTRAVLVVLDATGTMDGAPIATARAAAVDYLSALPADVHTGLVTFTTHPELTVPLTSDRQQVTAAVARVRTSGSGVLNDAVALAARTLSGVPGARRLLVLSDGEDAGGGASLDNALRLLSEARVNADVVALAGAAGAAPAGPEQIAARGRLALGSGGQVLAVADVKAQAAVFAPLPPQQLEVTAPVPNELSGRTLPLTVRVGANLSAATSVHAPDRRGGVMPSAPAWLRNAMLGLIFTVLFGLGWLLFARRSLARRVRPQRLTEVRRYRVRDGSTPETGAIQERSPLVRLLLGLTERAVSEGGARARIELDLDLAGIRLRPAEWLLVRFGLSTVLGVVLAAVTGVPLVFGPLGVLLGWFGTRLFLKVRIGMRRNAFAEQLPDTLQLVAGALRSGFSLSQALDSMVREGTQPIASEIARSLARTRLGVSVEDALANAAERMRCHDLAWVVMAIRIQREVGGNLAELLLTTVRTMRERGAVRRQVKALTAEGRLSAYVLLALPICLGTWMFMSRREYLEPLYTRPMGWAMLGVTAVCLTVGWFWMSKMINVEV